MRCRRWRGSFISNSCWRSVRLMETAVAIMSDSQPGSDMFMAKRWASSGMARSRETQRSNKSRAFRIRAWVVLSAVDGSLITRARTLSTGIRRVNSTTSTRIRPCTSAEDEPSGMESSRPTANSTPTGMKSSGPGSSTSGSLWVRPMTVKFRSWASWMASSELWRATKTGVTM